MGILSAASGTSIWRGYLYYTEKKVITWGKTDHDEYKGRVLGSAPEPYEVKINVAHVRRSHCNCPFAADTHKICKHMVALYFAAFPAEADQYIRQVEEDEREEQARTEQRHQEIKEYVKGLSIKELRKQLYEALIELEARENPYW